MFKRFSILLPALATLLLLLSVGQAENPFENLTQGQKIHGFSVFNLYENATGRAMGGRFVSDRYGYVLDILQIQSVPQAFIWVKTTPLDDRGEAHTCEHLLLSKGNVGRYVQALENMSLGSSSAYTTQLRTSYHFNTIAGEDTFYKIFEAKLRALLHPDFTDEEIRREVCHIGINAESDGKLTLEEKGTVYTEMVSSFEKPYYYHYRILDEMLFGPDHPSVNISGGDPAAIRTMVPANLREFHKAHYHLGNMGSVVSIPDNIPLDRFLTKMSEILLACQKEPDANPHPGIEVIGLPEPRPTQPVGYIQLGTYPGTPDQDRAEVAISWPANLDYDNQENVLLNLFLSTLGSGSTSNLYNYFINSQTRKFNLEGGSVNAYSSNDPGHPILITLSGMDNSYITGKMLDSVRGLIIGEAARIYNFADNSDSIRIFNDRVRSNLMESRRGIEDYLNSPPMFGYRSGPGGRWVPFLEFIEKGPGFRKSLVEKEYFARADSLLTTGENFWRKYIDHWKLLTVKPYVVGSVPTADIVSKIKEDKAKRIAGYVEDFKKKYGVNDDQAAIARYKEDFDRNTAELDRISSKSTIPPFIENPPLTLDEQLKYQTINLPNNVPLVASTFENMTSATVGLNLKLDVIPESLLVYIPALPSILTDIGVIKDGKKIPYDEMKNLIRQEIMRLYADLDVSYNTGRVELKLVGAGGNQEELKRALGWMEAALYSPDVSPENIPRMMDILDQALISYRNAMKAPEEYWVDYPALAYRVQTNPLLMTADCFLTQGHYIWRLKWLLTEPGNEKEQKEISSILDSMAIYGVGKNRTQLSDLLSALESPEKDTVDAMPVSIKALLAGSSEKTRSNLATIARNLAVVLADIPDGNLDNDWDYLCQEVKDDILVKPETAIAQMNYVLKLLRRADNARMFMISNSTDRVAAMEKINQLVLQLDSKEKSIRQQYAGQERITDHLREREPNLAGPVYVGLINESTRNGVLSLTAKLSGNYDTTDQSVLTCLTAGIFGGTGPYSLHSKTLGAGLAYSNGVAYNERNGRFRYYAERCPDIAETMRFVVDVARTSMPGPELLDYAMAQLFRNSRSGATYESRGEAMANDLADGYTPEIIQGYRQKVLQMRKTKDIFERMRSNIKNVYGSVLIGYGAPLKDVKDGQYFIIGPESQFASLDKYIGNAEGDGKVYRLYPRDFWLTD